MQRFYPPFIGFPGAAGLFLLRAVVGCALMLHGFSKIQNPFGWMGPESWAPAPLQALAALSEFGGGLALVIGLLTPLACVGILSTMFTAMTMVHLAHGDPFVAHGKGGSYELALVYFSVALTVLLLGPGKYSIDGLLFGKGSKPESLPDKSASPKVESTV